VTRLPGVWVPHTPPSLLRDLSALCVNSLLFQISDDCPLVENNNPNLLVLPGEPSMSMTRVESDARHAGGVAASASAGSPRFLLLIASLFTVAFLYFSLFVAGHAPLWLSGDQTIFLLNAERMLHGQVMYRDFFQFTLPGTEFVYLTFFKLFGMRAWIPNVCLILLGIGLTTCMVSISRKILNQKNVLLPALLFLVCSYHAMLNATHHWFSLLAMLAAIAVVIDARSIPRVALAGMFSGVAALFTHAEGLMCFLGLACFLVWERHWTHENKTVAVKMFSLFSAFCATLAVTCGYAIIHGGLANLWNCVVVFTLRYYSTDINANTPLIYLSFPGVPPWSHLPTLLVWLFIYAVVPFAYVLFLVRYWRRRPGDGTEPWDKLMLLNIVGWFLFLGTASSPSIMRLAAESPPAVILLVWLLETRSGNNYAPIKLLWAFGLTLAIAEPWVTNARPEYVLNLPAGRVAFSSPEQRDKYAWLAEHTHPSDLLFDGATLPRVYFPLSLRNPAGVPFLTTTNYTRPEQVQDVIRSLETKPVSLVIWSVDVDVPEDMNDRGDHLAPLRDYVRHHFRQVKTFPDGDQVWERRLAHDGTLSP
jgi:hypothetical protein